MSVGEIFKPSWIKVIFTLIIPLLVWYGMFYKEGSTEFRPEAKVDAIYTTWRILPYPLVVYIPMAIYDWNQNRQRIKGDDFVTNDLITFGVSGAVNYILACLLITFSVSCRSYSKSRSKSS